MNDAIELLAVPFLACLVLIAIHCQFGLQVLKRNVVFVDLALAQFAALGATVAFMQGHMPNTTAAYAWSLGFAWLAALLLSLIRYAPARVPHEALVGVLYVVAVAAAMLLIEKAPQGAEHLKQILTGSILTTDFSDLAGVVPMYLVIGTILAIAVRRHWFERAGYSGWLADFIFYAAFGLVVTSSVAMAGVLLVFTFLIIPALIGMLFARAEWKQLWVGWLAGVFASVLGLAGSYRLDTSTGATVVCSFGLILGLAFLMRSLGTEKIANSLIPKTIVVASVLVMGISMLWLGIQPKADQPVLDALESQFPSVRHVYLTQQEQLVHTDAQRYIDRYQSEIERLGKLEANARWQAKSLDDEMIQKISSFQQSYNEMVKGERFVMKEVRSRARERLRWPALAMALALLAITSAYFFRSQKRLEDSKRTAE